MTTDDDDDNWARKDNGKTMLAKRMQPSRERQGKSAKLNCSSTLLCCCYFFNAHIVLISQRNGFKKSKSIQQHLIHESEKWEKKINFSIKWTKHNSSSAQQQSEGERKWVLNKGKKKETSEMSWKLNNSVLHFSFAFTASDVNYFFALWCCFALLPSPFPSSWRSDDAFGCSLVRSHQQSSLAEMKLLYKDERETRRGRERS